MSVKNESKIKLKKSKINMGYPSIFESRSEVVKNAVFRCLESETGIYRLFDLSIIVLNRFILLNIFK